MDAQIDLHKDLKHGVLPCGIAYKILPCGKPQATVELRLIVNVGSFHEEDSERGFAHFVEHLGFKGTKSFSKYELVKMLEGLGIVYGPDLNASTHFMETKYRLSLQFDPSNLSERLDLGLKILLEWATSMSISADDVEEEKAVILAEYRGKQGLSNRLLETYWSQVFGEDSYYAKRFPIGVPEVFLASDSCQVKKFYEKWYRPENMTILIVGDVGDRVDEIQQLLFAKAAEISFEYPAVASAPTLPSHAAETPMWHRNDELISLSDPELTTSSVMIEFLQPLPAQATKRYVLRDVMLRLMTSIVDKRLLYLSKGFCVDTAVLEDVSAFKSAGISIRQLVRGLSCVGITASLSPQKQIDSAVGSQSMRDCIQQALCTIMLEMRRISELGINEEELLTAKERWRTVFQERQTGQVTVDSAALASELEAHVATDGNTVFAGPEVEAALAISCLEEVSISSMNEFLKMLDMHVDEESSAHYYSGAPVQGCFRVLTIQAPQIQATSNWTCDTASLRELLRSVRDQVQAVPVASLRQWPIAKMIAPEDIIAAADFLLGAGSPHAGAKPAASLEPNAPHERRTVAEPMPSQGGSVDPAVCSDPLSSPDSFYSTTSSTARSRRKCAAVIASCGVGCGCNPASFLPPSLLQAAKVKAKASLQGGAIGEYATAAEDGVVLALGSEPSGQTPAPGTPAAPSPNLSQTGQSSTNFTTETLQEIDALQVTLANGVTVCLKWMPDQSTNKVSMQAFALGGSSELTEEEEIAFSLADEVALHSGFKLPPSFSQRPEPESSPDPAVEPEHNVGGTGASPTSSAASVTASTADVFTGKDISELQHRLKTRVNTQRHDYFRGIGGSCPTAHVELLLALLVMKFTAQHFSSDEARKIVRSHAEGLEYRDNSPESVFMERARIICCGDIPICRPVTKEKMLNTPLDLPGMLHQRAFMLDPTAFTFVFVGDLPPKEVVLPLLHRYIGGLRPAAAPLCHSAGGPWLKRLRAQGLNDSEITEMTETDSRSLQPTGAASKSTPEGATHTQLQQQQQQQHPPFTPLGSMFPKSRVRETVRRRVSEKASNLLVFRADLPRNDCGDFSATVLLDVACKALQGKLLEELRIRLGKVYSVVAEKSRNSLSSFALISIVTDCAPGDLSEIQAVMEAQIEAMQQDGPDEARLAGIKEAMLQQHAQAMLNPSYWLFWILDAYKALRVYSHYDPLFSAKSQGRTADCKDGKDTELTVAGLILEGLADYPSAESEFPAKEGSFSPGQSLSEVLGSTTSAAALNASWIDRSVALRSVRRPTMLRTFIARPVLAKTFQTYFCLDRSATLSLQSLESTAEADADGVSAAAEPPLSGGESPRQQTPAKIKAGVDLNAGLVQRHSSSSIHAVN